MCLAFNWETSIEIKKIKNKKIIKKKEDVLM